EESGLEPRNPVESALPPSVFDHDFLAFDKARLIQSFSKRADDVEERGGGPGVKKSHHRHGRLLRARRARPCSRRAAEQRDELASLHCPMPSRAPDRKDSTHRHGRLLHPSSWAK